MASLKVVGADYVFGSLRNHGELEADAGEMPGYFRQMIAAGRWRRQRPVGLSNIRPRPSRTYASQSERSTDPKA